MSADGVGVFTRSLQRGLTRIGTHSEICYVRRKGPLSCAIELGSVDDSLRFRSYAVTTSPLVTLPYKLPSTPLLHYLNSHVVLPTGFDIYHFTSSMPFVKKVDRSVLTIYDLVQFVLPEVSGLEERLRLWHFYKTMGPRCLFVHAISNYVKNEILSLLRLERVEVVYPGVDTSIFKPKRFVRRGRFIMQVGSGRKKNSQFLLRVFSELVKSRSDLRLVKVEYDKTDLELAMHLGIKDRVIWLSGISREELAGWYAAAECYVSPSLHEGFGLAVLEAMACGTPAVVSDRGALPEVVGGNGVVVRGWDIESWSKACLDLLDHKAFRKDLSNAAIERAKLFEARNTAYKINELYERYRD